MDLFSWALVMVLCNTETCDAPAIVAGAHNQAHCRALASFYEATTPIPEGFEMTFVCPTPQVAKNE